MNFKMTSNAIIPNGYWRAQLYITLCRDLMGCARPPEWLRPAWDSTRGLFVCAKKWVLRCSRSLNKLEVPYSGWLYMVLNINITLDNERDRYLSYPPCPTPRRPQKVQSRGTTHPYRLLGNLSLLIHRVSIKNMNIHSFVTSPPSDHKYLVLISISLASFCHIGSISRCTRTRVLGTPSSLTAGVRN